MAWLRCAACGLRRDAREFVVTTDTITRKRGTIEPGGKHTRASLEAELDRVQAEIRKYPPPIPACDAYFNHLLEERGRISDELTRLNTTARNA